MTIMLAVQPEYIRLILSGKKTVEVRKRRLPISPCRVLLYCTRSGEKLYKKRKSGKTELMNGHVVGHCMANSRCVINARSQREDIELFMQGTCLTSKQLFEYWSGSRNLFGWQLSNVQEYGELLDVSYFGVDHAPQSYLIVDEDEEDA